MSTTPSASRVRENRRGRARRAAAVLLSAGLLVTLTAACDSGSDDGSDAAEEDTTTTAEEAPAEDEPTEPAPDDEAEDDEPLTGAPLEVGDPCELLTQEEAEAAVGTELEPIPPGPTACGYATGEAGEADHKFANLAVRSEVGSSLRRHAQDQASFLSAGGDEEAEVEAVDGLGDAAFAAEFDTIGLVVVGIGAGAMTIGVKGAADPLAAALELAEKLVAQV